MSKKRGKKKKSYNPFKMWGSYVGLIVIFILLIFIGFNSGTHKRYVRECSDYQSPDINPKDPSADEQPTIIAICEANHPFECAGFQSQSCSTENFLIQSIIISLILWIPLFFIGWGIHSLVRSQS